MFNAQLYLFHLISAKMPRSDTEPYSKQKYSTKMGIVCMLLDTVAERHHDWLTLPKMDELVPASAFDTFLHLTLWNY